MVILQPGGSMDPGIILALGSGICFAFYLIATRRAAQGSDPIKTLVFQCVIGAALLTPQAVMSWSTPAGGLRKSLPTANGMNALQGKSEWPR